MSLHLSGLGLSISSSIKMICCNRKPINHFAVSCNTKNSVCNAWGSKCAAENKRLWSLQLDYKRQLAFVTNCYKLSVEEDVSLDRGSKENSDLVTKVAEVYSLLKSELLNDPDLEWTYDSRQWVNQMLDYNVPKGDIWEGIHVISTFKLLKDEGEELSEDEVFDATVLMWCSIWLLAASQIFDDFMDNSHTRHDQPCWFRHAKVGNIALNDAILLIAHVPRILKKHLGEKPYYVDLLDLFNGVVFQASFGQTLDLITDAGETDLSDYTMQIYRHIAKYKTASQLYLPVACALLLAGENLENHGTVKDVLVELGIHFQIMNDYQDCFGNPKKTGKIGTDIESFKCSWLVVRALELANEEQKKILQEHYGKANPSDVAKVKAVYNDINLRGVFAVYENESYNKLRSSVEAYPNKVLNGAWACFARYRQLFKLQDS